LLDSYEVQFHDLKMDNCHGGFTPNFKVARQLWC